MTINIVPIRCNMKNYEKKEFVPSDNFIFYVTHTTHTAHTNNMYIVFIHNSFGSLTPSQTMYTKPLFGTHTPTYTHAYLYIRSHIYADTRRILTHSVDIHDSVHDTCILYTMIGGH